MNAMQTDWLGTIRQTLAKALVLLLCSLNAMPAWSAGSTLYQAPPFTSTEPPANIFMMLDDSGSMARYDLPTPVGISIDKTKVATKVTIKGQGADSTNTWAERSWTIDRDYDWALRAPALNPLWYNPANRYVPWNKDGTLMPNASIGGSVAKTNYGEFTSRANPAELTERDPRQVPDNKAFKSLRPPVGTNDGAGRGLLGTDSSTLFSASDPLTRGEGRRVTIGATVDFKYHKLPFDFGPILSELNGAPRNGHADRAWTTHDDTTRPLDLFSRPLQVTGTTSNSGCFASESTCKSGAAALTKDTYPTWNRTNCFGKVENFTSDPGTLTCWRQKDCTGNWINYDSKPGLLYCRAVSCTDATVKKYSSDPGELSCFSRPNCANKTEYSDKDPGTLDCGYTWTDCYGATQNSTTDGTDVICPRRIENCDGKTWTNNPVSPTLTCYRNRACAANASWNAWTSTNPNPTACWTQANCSGGTDYIVRATTPSDRTCQWAQNDCAGNTKPFDTKPKDLTCYKQKTCTGTESKRSTPFSPATLACDYSRMECGATTATVFAVDKNPGDLTCYTRQNCDGKTTGPTATVLETLTCRAPTEPFPTYTPQITTNKSTLREEKQGTWIETAKGGGTYSATTYPVLDTQTKTRLDASTITKTYLGTRTVSSFKQSVTTFEAEKKEPNVSTQGAYGSICPTGSIERTCTVPALPGVPDPGALTPARYYRFTGGDKGLPENYQVVQIDRTRPSYSYPVIDATTGIAPTELTSQRLDCAAKTSCTWLEEAQNYANWFLYYRNRLFAAQAVMADSLSSLRSTSQQSLRLGYGRINNIVGSYKPWLTAKETSATVDPPNIDGAPNPGALVRGVRPFIINTPERSDFFDWLFSVSWQAGTPNREAVDSVGRYFMREDNAGPWGATPGKDDGSPQLACRRNSLFLTTDGEWTGSPGTPTEPGQEADNVAAPTITGQGPNAGAKFTYVPKEWPQFTGGDSQSNTLTDAAVYYWNRDLRPNLDNVILPVTESLRPNPAFWQSMSTYIIGYGLSASMDTAATRAAVTSGATVTWPTVNAGENNNVNRVNDSLRAALASRGNFYAAQTVAELKSSMLGSFREIATRQGSAGGVAVTGPAITSGSQAFFPSYATGKWTGTLKAYKSTDLEELAKGNDVKPDWTATLPAFGSRNILSSNSKEPKSPIAFDVTKLDDSQKSSLTSTAEGFSYTVAEAVNYLRGDQSLELPATGIAAGKKFRRRESLLGDIVNSTPLYVKAPDYGYGAMSTIGQSYASYVASRRSGTVATVYVGANDGMFHAFDAATGVERFAYVPRGVYPTLANLLNPGYEHNYYVDGPVTAGDWHNGSSWQSIVIGTTGAGGANGGANGGSGVFAIDVTNQESSKVKWDLTRSDSKHLGHILNRGIVGRIKTSTGTQWVYMVGNGYESRSNMAALLVIDIDNGDIIKEIPVGPTWYDDSGNAARNGMGGITVMYDSERNIKLVYGGDRQGNLWRFDFSSGIPAGAKGFGNDKALFSTGTSTRPISAAPRLVPHPLGGMLIVFGTGKLHDITDGTDTASQGIYAIWDKPQYTDGTVANSKVESLTVKTADATRTINTKVDWNDKMMGWSAELTGGERIISDPTADTGSLTVTSYAPSAALDPCNGGGVSYIYRFNFATGIITGVQVTGVVGAVTPLTVAPQVTARSESDGVNISAGISAAKGGTGTTTPSPGTTSQCRLYSTSIQGRPNVIAVNCPNFAPMRVWRQPVR